jgi:hypothetical protein
MDSYVIKLTGKAELPEPIAIGHNVRTTLEGSIISETISDNDDGTKTHIYAFRPVIVEVIKETGERIKAKDTRSRSQQLRSLIFRQWREQNIPQDFDEYYERRMLEIMQSLHTV